MTPLTGASLSPWLTAEQSAGYLGCGVKLVYREVAAGRLRAARIGGKRAIRIKAAWLDEYLEASAEPVEITPRPAIRRVG